MNPYWSPIVHDLVPYVPWEQPKLEQLVKLNTNENPYGPSPRALEAMRAATGDSLRLYPDPNSEALKTALAGHLRVLKVPCVMRMDAPEAPGGSYVEIDPTTLPAMAPEKMLAKFYG